MTALDKALTEAAPLANFSPARGYTYLPPTSKTTGAGSLSARASKENTPLPDSAFNKVAKDSLNAATENGTDTEDLKTLLDAFAMAHRYSKEYMDDAPLTGEPGNFVLSKSKDEGKLFPGLQGTQSAAKSPFQSAPSKDKSSSTSSPLPSLDTDVSKAKRTTAKNGEQGANPTPTSAKDKKRKKSKSAASPTG